MNPETREGLVRRESIIELLSDDEVAKVSTAEGSGHLSHGDEFIDLSRLDRGVRQADGVVIPMANVLPRAAVDEQTWAKIVELLAAKPVGAEAATKNHPPPRNTP